MFNFVIGRHKIQADGFPIETILFDGEVVSKKSFGFGAVTHLFHDISDGVEYEVILYPFITNRSMLIARQHVPFMGYKIIRDGVTIYNTDYSFGKDQLKIYLLDNDDEFEICKGDRAESIHHNGSIVSSKSYGRWAYLEKCLNLMQVSTHTFKIHNNDRTTATYLVDFKPVYNCEIRKNGKLIANKDTSKTPENASKTVNALKELGILGIKIGAMMAPYFL